TGNSPTVFGISPLTFPPPYQYQFDPTATNNNSPIQSLTLTALGYGNPNIPPAGAVTASTYVLDPGIRFPWLDLTFTNMGNYNSSYSAPLATPMIPPIPPRRLFQPPDRTANTNASSTGDPTLNG